jgi:hypothetical protein
VTIVVGLTISGEKPTKVAAEPSAAHSDRELERERELRANRAQGQWVETPAQEPTATNSAGVSGPVPPTPSALLKSMAPRRPGRPKRLVPSQRAHAPSRVGAINSVVVPVPPPK